ncbi:MAG: transposase [Methylococcales bacterium]|nr:transposase [Methylococcales bacterium]
MRYKAYRFRLEPTSSQREQLGSIAGSCRFIYNHFLATHKERYALRKEQSDPTIKFLTYPETSRWLTLLKREEATSWLQLSYHDSLQQSLMDLDRAIKGWLRKKTGFPRFKKRGVRDAFRLPRPPKIDGNLLKLPKLGWVRFRKSREVIGVIKSATVSREGDHWFISLLTEQCENLVPHPSSSWVGVDLGVTHFVTLSTGEHIDLPKLSHLIERVTSLQQRLSHKQKGSHNSQKAQHRLSTAHRRLRRVRHDFLHKVTTHLAKNHSVVVMEDLKVGNMMKSAKGNKDHPGRCVAAKSGLNRAIAQQAWSTFRQLLSYKLADLNGELNVVDPRYTSQTCPVCLTVDRRNRKSQSHFSCVSCGHTVNADYNAAVNILSLATVGRAVN